MKDKISKEKKIRWRLLWNRKKKLFQIKKSIKIKSWCFVLFFIKLATANLTRVNVKIVETSVNVLNRVSVYNYLTW